MYCEFRGYELMTTDVEGARAFYRDLFGWEMPVSELPEQARSRGAPAHWLGNIAVPDIRTTAQHMVDLGAQLLGPTRRSAQAGETSVVRDPLGAVAALACRRQPGVQLARVGPGGQVNNDVRQR
jgi:predicted enzyme related to lactoylglutathione lyase